MFSQSDLTRLRRSAIVMRESKEAAAAAFYANLFDTEPALRGMFPDQMAEQERKFAATLVVVVNSILDWDSLRPVVEALARRHVSYGVTAEHYQTVGTVLMDTLQKLGASPEDLLVWRRTYEFLAGHMVATAYPA